MYSKNEINKQPIPIVHASSKRKPTLQCLWDNRIQKGRLETRLFEINTAT